MASPSGLLGGTDYGDAGYWWSDGYSDYLRHFNWVMGAIPEWAPIHQNHLLQSSSVVQKVHYGTRSVVYVTFDPAASEVLRLSFRPVEVTAGNATLAERKDPSAEGYTVKALPQGDFVVRVRHQNSESVGIKG